MLIASQLEPFFNQALSDRLDVEVQPIPRGVPAALPTGTRLLIVAPMLDMPDQTHQTERMAPPQNWPFDLDWIQLVSSGTDFYPSWLLDTVPVSTARGVAAGPIAEYVIATIFEAVKAMHTVWIDNPQAWHTRPFTSIEGTHLGLLGYGAIGRAVALRAKGLGMNVHVLRRSAPDHCEKGVTFLNSIEELLAVSDHLVLAAPATPHTKHILNARSLRAAKTGIHIINVARGSLVDDDALLDALAAGTIGRATLDTTSPEPLPAGHPFYDHPRVRISPHTAAIGHGSRLALVEKIAINLKRRRQGQDLLDPP